MNIFWVGEKKYEEIDMEDGIEIEIDDNKEDIFEDEWQVALDIIENPDEIIIVSPIAGVEFNELDIWLKDDILTISWERKKPLELYLNGSILRVSETFWGPFSRNIILPENLDLDSIKAILEKNILIIRIPKLKFKSHSIVIEKIED